MCLIIDGPLCGQLTTQKFALPMPVMEEVANTVEAFISLNLDNIPDGVHFLLCLHFYV